MFKKLPKLNAVDSAIVLGSAYDVEYGVHNHFKQAIAKPLSSVAFHDVENPNDGSLMETILRIYIAKNIREIYGLSIAEYLEMPVDVVDMLNRSADEENRRKSNIAASVEQQFHSDSKK
jgi:hypothetical protein